MEISNKKSIYENAKEYDHKYGSYVEDYELIQEWANRTKGRILDLGCGTGRILFRLVDEGKIVDGVDLSKEMLELAKQKAEMYVVKPNFYCMNLTDLQLEKAYSMMYMVGNTFQHILTNSQQDEMLIKVYEHLSTGGIFIFDTRMPKLDELKEIDRYTEEYINHNQQKVIEHHYEQYDLISQILECTIQKEVYDNELNQLLTTTQEYIHIKYTFPQELLRMLHQHGFEVLHQYGGWNCQSLESKSNSIITICRKC